VGGLIAASLAKSGATVTLVVRGEAITRYPDILQLESPFGKCNCQSGADYNCSGG